MMEHKPSSRTEVVVQTRGAAETAGEAQSRRRNPARALSALHNFASAAGEILEPVALGQLVVDSAHDLLAIDNVALYQADPEAGVLRLLAESGPKRAEADLQVQPGAGLVGQAYETGRPVVVPDYPNWPGARRRAHLQGLQSALAVPPRMCDRPLGALVALSFSHRAFKPQHVRLLELLAAQVAPLLEASRLQADSEQRRVQAEAMAELVREGAASPCPDKIINLICERATKHVGADYAGVRIVDEAGNVVWRGMWGNRSDAWTRPRRARHLGSATKAVQTGRTFITRTQDAIDQGLAIDPTSVRANEGGLVELATPLTFLGRVLGALVLGWRTEVIPSQAQVRLAEALAAYGAAVLDNAQSRVESEAKRAEAEALANLVRDCAAGNDLNRAISLICERGSQLLKAQYFGIRLIREDRGIWWYESRSGRAAKWLPKAPGSGIGATSKAVAERRTVLIERLDRNAFEGRRSINQTKGTVLATPMIGSSEPLGAIRIGWQEDVSPTPSQIRLAEALASYAAVMLENAHAQATLAEQALYDSLTGLPNRRLLQDRLSQAILSAQRGDRRTALLLLDLDRFKEVNDTLGHAAGDRLLQEIGRRLQSVLRKSDTVARLGGDEFAILLTPVQRSEGAAIVAAKVLEVLSAPIVLQDRPIRIDGSIGIALCPEHGGDAETLLRHADVAMYAAKQAHEGYVRYDPKMDSETAGRLMLASDLGQAVALDQLMLEFQPRLDLASGQPDGMEALVRWRHPELGIVPPDQFIPLAEQTGSIRQLSRWVLDAAFRHRETLSVRGVELPVAVNLSMLDLHDPLLTSYMGQLMERWKPAKGQLVVEITESAMMSNPAIAQATLAGLRTLGARISIDDFGTGYSSLSYLRQLAVDELKIDRSFVQRMASSAKDRAIVQATIDLGHALGAYVIAEGVEDEETLDLLRRLGCDSAQGYHISRPMAIGDLERWVRRQ